jgi:hypothetical protein
MEMRHGFEPTRSTGGWHHGSGFDSWQAGFYCALVFLFAFAGARAAPFQLLSIGSTSPTAAQAIRTNNAFGSQLSASFGRLPLTFEPADIEGGSFLCRGPGSRVLLSPVEAILTFDSALTTPRRVSTVEAFTSRSTGEAPTGSPLQIRLLGANNNSRAVPEEEMPTKVNYFIGNNPARWRTQVSTYGKVHYQGVYPGIDLVYYGNQQELEYDFVIAPGANPEEIAWCFEGAEWIQIEDSGSLLVHTIGGKVRQRRPIAYQIVKGERNEISAKYVIEKSEGRTVRFEIGEYDRALPLIIDPVLVYSSFLGGAGNDKGWDIAVDNNGNAYLTGETTSANFPTNNALYPTNGGGVLRDVFVAKLGVEGTNLVYSTYLGGSGDDAAFGLALDVAGDVYLTGVTASPNFPIVGQAISTNLHGSAVLGLYPYDAFVVKLSSGGSNLLYSTFIGGTQNDGGNAIVVDNAGQIYVAGATDSSDFPTNGTTRPFAGGFHDAFVLKLTTGSTNLIYSSYLGGQGDDFGFGVAVDSAGSAVVVGLTGSPDFPFTTNAFQTNFAGGQYDVFITKFSPDGVARLFSTYLGGSGDDETRRVVLNDLDQVCLAGFTTSLNFPTRNALYPTNSGLTDAFIVKLDGSGTNLIYSTYLGGAFNDEAWGIAVDTNRNLYVIGRSSSTDFPVVNPYQSILRGLGNVFVSRLNASGTALDYSTYLGGFNIDDGYGIAVDHAGNAYITGLSSSLDFPVYPTTNSPGSVFAGGNDSFVAKLFPRNAVLRTESPGAGDVSVLWPYGLPHFELQSADDLKATNTNWATVTNTAPTVVGEDYSLTFTNVSGNQFFRLFRSQ